MSPVYLFVLILIALCHASLALWVFCRRPADAQHQSFSLFEIGVTLWILGDVLMLATRSFAFDNLVLGGGITMLMSLVLLADTLPNNTSFHHRFWYAVLPLLGLYVALPFGVFFRGTGFARDGTLIAQIGPGFPALICIFSAYSAYGLVRVWRSYSRSSGLQRLQLQYLLFGAFAFIGVMFAFDVALPVLRVFRFTAFGPVASLLIAIAAAYAFYRQKLMDIRIVLQRSAVYSIVVGIASVLFFSLLIGFELMLHRRPDGAALAGAGNCT